MTDSPLQLPLGIRLPETTRFENFVAGRNAQALSAIQSVAAGEGGSVYVWGRAGIGKSHLLQATCRRAADTRRAAYLPLRQFAGQAPSILTGFAALDIVCIDELDAIAGNDDWEQALIGLFDQLRVAGSGILAAGGKAPGALGLQRADLSSRLGWGPVYGLHELDDADKRLLLQRRAHGRGMRLSDEVAHYLLRRSRRDTGSLMALLDRLDQASLAAQRRLTIPFVKQVISRNQSASGSG